VIWFTLQGTDLFGLWKSAEKLFNEMAARRDPADRRGTHKMHPGFPAAHWFGRPYLRAAHASREPG
jgi:hypothetical protein